MGASCRQGAALSITSSAALPARSLISSAAKRWTVSSSTPSQAAGLSLFYTELAVSPAAMASSNILAMAALQAAGSASAPQPVRASRAAAVTTEALSRVRMVPLGCVRVRIIAGAPCQAQGFGPALRTAAHHFRPLPRM